MILLLLLFSFVPSQGRNHCPHRSEASSSSGLFVSCYCRTGWHAWWFCTFYFILYFWRRFFRLW